MTMRGVESFGFNPPQEAEPSLSVTEADQWPIQSEEQPTVLSKLQKWGSYPSLGLPVYPTRFLPMKTPMSEEILSNWSLPEPPQHTLSVRSLLAETRQAGRPLGLIIDLANHDCLYADDLPADVAHSQVALEAKVLPTQSAVDQVARLAQACWAERPEGHVAIHCAYGFNRTGFVVCSYLCQEEGLSVDEALQSFAAARPPGVKHEKFVAELYRRYGHAEGRRKRGAVDGCAAPAPSPATLVFPGPRTTDPWDVRVCSFVFPPKRKEPSETGSSQSAGSANSQTHALEPHVERALEQSAEHPAIDTSCPLPQAPMNQPASASFLPPLPARHAAPPEGGTHPPKASPRGSSSTPPLPPRTTPLRPWPLAGGVEDEVKPLEGACACAAPGSWRPADEGADELAPCSMPTPFHGSAGGISRRTVSMDSENHSLGFGAREALSKLRHEEAARGKPLSQLFAPGEEQAGVEVCNP
ncbi:hypothetical protein H632_c121p1 [Helicosporidium sp. ATCC 50920]|nr:hypothetical protein H632_c121p1 [Helicosporidium sp. ATCC 50920]|eukprot:KDD76743.1 hypothetical protein H632_c121p1 [Helicosporidium sp. ATCC 50920]